MKRFTLLFLATTIIFSGFILDNVDVDTYLARQKEAMRALYNLLPDGAKVGALASLDKHPRNPRKWLGVEEVSGEITLELYLAQQKVVMAKLYQLLPDGARKDDAIASLNNHPSNWVGVRKVSEEGFILLLDLSNNQLTGAIPRALGNLTKLQTLDLYDNQLTGPIPRELGQLTELKELDLSSNQLTGAIPRELGLLTKLQYISLHRNQLTGPIPTELGQMTELQDLDLSSNQLTGEIPRELGLLTELQVLDLSSNQLTGAIPRELGQLTQLQDLCLSGNQLTGPTPPELIREGLTVSRVFL